MWGTDGLRAHIRGMRRRTVSEPETGPVAAEATVLRVEKLVSWMALRIKSEKKTGVEAENLGSSQPAGTELLSQAKEEMPSPGSAGLENVPTGGGSNSQASFEGDPGSESDPLSVCESRSMDDLFSSVIILATLIASLNLRID